jgi:hypothetical protein
MTGTLTVGGEAPVILYLSAERTTPRSGKRLTRR